MWDQSVPGPRPLKRAHWVLCDALRMVAGAGFGFVLSLRVFDSPGPSDLGTELLRYAGTSCCNWEPECHFSREPGSVLVLSWVCREQWMQGYWEESQNQRGLHLSIPPEISESDSQQLWFWPISGMAQTPEAWEQCVGGVYERPEKLPISWASLFCLAQLSLSSVEVISAGVSCSPQQWQDKQLQWSCRAWHRQGRNSFYSRCSEIQGSEWDPCLYWRIHSIYWSFTSIKGTSIVLAASN